MEDQEADYWRQRASQMERAKRRWQWVAILAMMALAVLLLSIGTFLVFFTTLFMRP